MPRDANGTFSKPPGTTAAPGATITSAQFNSTVDDIVEDLNDARPLTAGGTGGTSAATARTNLGVALAQTTTTDTTAGSGLIVGGFGIGGTGVSAGGDLDLAVYTGVYNVAAATTNTPAGTGPSGSTCFSNRFDADNVQQIFVYRGTTTTDLRLYMRHKRSGTWGAWLPATGEEGSTANGYYIKYASGWVEMFSTGLTFTRSTDVRATVTWTLPLAVVASPQVRIWVCGFSTDSADYTGDISTSTEVGHLVYDHDVSITTSVSLGLQNISGSAWASGTIKDVYVAARGRWY